MHGINVQILPFGQFALSSLWGVGVKVWCKRKQNFEELLFKLKIIYLKSFLNSTVMADQDGQS